MWPLVSTIDHTMHSAIPFQQMPQVYAEQNSLKTQCNPAQHPFQLILRVHCGCKAICAYKYWLSVSFHSRWFKMNSVTQVVTLKRGTKYEVRSCNNAKMTIGHYWLVTTDRSIFMLDDPKSIGFLRNPQTTILPSMAWVAAIVWPLSWWQAIDHWSLLTSDYSC
jgi:hypothetical protein